MTTRRLMEELQRRVRSLDSASRANAGASPRARRGAGVSGRELGGATAARSPSRRRGVFSKAPPPPTRDPALLEQIKRSTPAKVGVGRAGLRYRTQTLLQFMADFSVAKAAVNSEVPQGWPEQQGWIALKTAAADAEQFLARPDLGRLLSERSVELVRSRFVRAPDVQIVVGDGLSADAVMQNAPAMVQSLQAELSAGGLSLGTLAFVRHCRAKIVDVIGEIVSAKVGVILVGERPGLGTGDGMSAYLVWNPRAERTDAEKQAISNVHRRGLLPEDAGRFAARLVQAIVAQQTSGVHLDISGIDQPRADRRRINQAHPEPEAGCGQSHGQRCPPSDGGLPGQSCGRLEQRPCETSAR